MSLFHKTPQRFLGVDIGAGGIKLVELANDKRRARLSTYGFAELSESHDRTAKSLGGDLERLAATLRELKVRTHAEAEHAVTSLPVASVFNAVIALPRMKKKDLPAAVEWEAKKLLPLPFEEMIIDWKLLTPEEALEDATNEATSIRVLLTAAPKALVQEYLAVFRSAEIELLSLETEAFALIRALVGDDPAIVLVLDIGAARTSMVVVEDGTPILSRSVDVGGNTITQAIAAAMGGDVARAEQVKLDLAVTPTGNPAAAALPAMFDRLFASVVQEAKYLLNLYLSQDGNRSRVVEKCILAGGSALLPGLTEHFAKQLNLRVFVGDPWARVIYPEDLRPTLDTIGPRFAVAVGLGMREIT